MKRLYDKISAQNHHKQVCEQAIRIERDLNDLTLKVSEIQKFFKEQNWKNIQNQKIRSAENELIRLNRKISSLKIVLKNLSDVRFPEIDDFNNQSSNKIDKNVRKKILELRPEGDEVDNG